MPIDEPNTRTFVPTLVSLTCAPMFVSVLGDRSSDVMGMGRFLRRLSSCEGV